MPNAYGLYDILGNAAEWVDDIYTGGGLDVNEGETPPFIDPVGYLNDDESMLRTIRSGAVIMVSCKCAGTGNLAELAMLRNFRMGLRPVRTIFEEQTIGGYLADNV